MGNRQTGNCTNRPSDRQMEMRDIVNRTLNTTKRPKNYLKIKIFAMTILVKPMAARKYFSPSNLLTLYKVQIRPSLEYCSHIWGAAAPTTLSILDAVQRRAIRLIGDPALTCHLQLLSHWRAVGDNDRISFRNYVSISCLILITTSHHIRIQAPEMLMHLLSACRTYAGTAYVHRHNAALRVLYYHLRHSYGIDETPVLPYAPGDIESVAVVENERCRIYWNYSFPTLELVQANKPDIVLLDHQQNTMFVIEFSAPAEVNIVSKEDEKRTKYQELLGQLRRLWPDYAVSLLVMVIGSLGGMRNTLLSALRAIPVCRAAAHILAARMQKAVILGSLRLLRAHDTRTQ
nr:unnamed protein product [Callosobruchus chinensis]